MNYALTSYSQDMRKAFSCKKYASDNTEEAQQRTIENRVKVPKARLCVSNAEGSSTESSSSCLTY